MEFNTAWQSTVASAIVALFLGLVVGIGIDPDTSLECVWDRDFSDCPAVYSEGYRDGFRAGPAWVEKTVVDRAATWAWYRSWELHPTHDEIMWITQPAAISITGDALRGKFVCIDMTHSRVTGKPGTIKIDEEGGLTFEGLSVETQAGMSGVIFTDSTNNALVDSNFIIGSLGPAGGQPVDMGFAVGFFGVGTDVQMRKRRE